MDTRFGNPNDTKHQQLRPAYVNAIAISYENYLKNYNYRASSFNDGIYNFENAFGSIFRNFKTYADAKTHLLTTLKASKGYCSNGSKFAAALEKCFGQGWLEDTMFRGELTAALQPGEDKEKLEFIDHLCGPTIAYRKQQIQNDRLLRRTKIASGEIPIEKLEWHEHQEYSDIIERVIANGNKPIQLDGPGLFTAFIFKHERAHAFSLACNCVQCLAERISADCESHFKLDDLAKVGELLETASSANIGFYDFFEEAGMRYRKDNLGKGTFYDNSKTWHEKVRSGYFTALRNHFAYKKGKVLEWVEEPSCQKCGICRACGIEALDKNLFDAIQSKNADEIAAAISGTLSVHRGMKDVSNLRYQVNLATKFWAVEDKEYWIVSKSWG